MPATVTGEPLGLSCVFSDGSTAVLSFDAIPCHDLVRDLLTGLVELIHPHGTVDSAGSVRHFVAAFREMARVLDSRGFDGGARDLRRGQVIEYWLGTSSAREACTRRALVAFDMVHACLHPRVRELASGRAYNPQPFRRPLPPYTEAEWARLAGACQRIVDDSFTGHKAALADAERGRHPADGGWSPVNLRWLLARTGPASATIFAQHLGWPLSQVRARVGLYQAAKALFPHCDVVIAYRLLFGVYSGIVPDGIDDLKVGDIDWAGDATILLRYVKGRTAAESLTLPRRAVRLLEQWLSHSALLRSFTSGDVSRSLWLWLPNKGTSQALAGPPNRNSILRWIQRHDVTADSGKPLKLNRSHIRTTHLSMRDKSGWAGRRTTIDPNHSAQVEGDNYLSATTPAQRQAVETIVEDAQHDLLRRGQPPIILSEPDTVALARDYPQIVTALRLDGEVIEELVGGRRDVFVAACVDQLSGLHGPKGQPCPARPWVCLICPLAVFAPRHAVNLLRLKAFFGRQWQQMPAAAFMAVFGAYSQRVDEILARFDPAQLALAAGQVTGRDEELPLRPEESTR